MSDVVPLSNVMPLSGDIRITLSREQALMIYESLTLSIAAIGEDRDSAERDMDDQSLATALGHYEEAQRSLRALLGRRLGIPPEEDR